jgi:hypothetical protein
MAAELHAHVVARNVGTEARRGQRGILFHGRLDPFLRIGRLRHGERHGGARSGEHGVLHVRDLAQQLLRGRELALGSDEIR